VSERRHELADAETLLGEKGIKPSLVEGHGDPAEAIIDQGEGERGRPDRGGNPRRGAAARMLLGSVSTKVVHEAPCDVLVVR
jgi:nucleotide-binding universal stress UspA family protein